MHQFGPVFSICISIAKGMAIWLYKSLEEINHIDTDIILTSAGCGLVIFGLPEVVVCELVVVLVWFIGLLPEWGDGSGGPLVPGGRPSNVKATYGPAEKNKNRILKNWSIMDYIKINF